MCSIKVTLTQANGSQQTFDRSVKRDGSDGISELSALRTCMGEVQSDLNTALTVLVDKEKAANAASGKMQNTKGAGDQENEEEADDEEDDDDNCARNGDAEPPAKIRKTS